MFKQLSAIKLLIIILLFPLTLLGQKQKKESFIVHSKTAEINSVDIKFKKSKLNAVYITLSSKSAGSTFSESPSGNEARWAAVPPPQISNITLMEGFYSSFEKRTETQRSNSYQLTQVKYPLRLKIEISNQNLDIEILEEGDWEVKIMLDNIYNPGMINTPFN